MWSNGYSLEAIRDRVTSATEIRKAAPQLEGRDLERRSEAATELNRDLEHFVAKGSSISRGLHQVDDAHKAVLGELVQGCFQVFSAWAGMEAAAGDIEAIGDRLGRLLKQGGNVHASPQQHALASLLGDSQALVESFPHLGQLPPSEENLAGMRRLHDLFHDPHLEPALREKFIAAAKERVGHQAVPPAELHDVLSRVVKANPATFMRKGARTPREHLLKMGGLKRACH